MKQSLRNLLSFGIFLPLLLVAGACSQTELEIAKAANQALTDWTANKTISEQFVKDVKKNLEPADPEYEKIMGSYEKARDQYNEYIRNTQDAIKTGKAPLLTSDLLSQLNDSNAGFLATAAKGIDPGVDRRRLQFDKGIVIPKLGSATRKLSSDARTLLSARILADASWKPWSQIEP